MTEPYWMDGRVTLYHGDCREVLEWLSADVLVTDPPYGIGWSSRGGWTNAYGGGCSKPQQGIANDDDTTARDEALTLWGDKPAAVFGDLLKHRPAGAVHVLIYGKSDDAGIRGARGGWRRDAEGIFLVGRWPVSVGGRSSVLWTNGRVAGPRGFAVRYGHPHAKAVDVMEDVISGCPPGTVADPFAGAESTLVAAMRQGRPAIGVEIDERHCETTDRRLVQGVLEAS